MPIYEVKLRLKCNNYRLKNDPLFIDLKPSSTKLFYSIYLVFLFVSLILYLEYDIFALGFLCLGSFIFVIMGLISKKVEGGLTFFIILTGFIFTLIMGNILTTLLENLTMSTGDKIIYALEQYYEEYQTFPDSLKQLEPKYLNKIPSPRNRLRGTFYYEKHGKKNYRIRFSASAFMIYEYERSNGKWIYGD